MTEQERLLQANLEALMDDENLDRDDCEKNDSEICWEIVVYPDAYGEDGLLGYAKKIGWI